jgi:hypothetical protein
VCRIILPSPIADVEVGIKILIFSKYGILPYKMTEKIYCSWIVYVLFMELWKTSPEAIFSLALDDCFRYIFVVTPIS